MNSNYRAFVENHESLLAPYATKSSSAILFGDIGYRGTGVDLSAISLTEESYRTPFQIDADRILYSRYMPLLANKTQIFISPESSHYRTRASHTQIVANLAVHMARGLGLNQELTLAISLGHDIGHTPFGHAGEQALDALATQEYCCMNGEEVKEYRPDIFRDGIGRTCEEWESFLLGTPILAKLKEPSRAQDLKGEFMVQERDSHIFSHSRQSIRLISLLGGKNITGQTAYGIVVHASGRGTAHPEFTWHYEAEIKRPKEVLKEKYDEGKPIQHEVYRLDGSCSTLEGKIVKFADFLAFAIHDFDDAHRSGLIDLEVVKRNFETAFPSKRFIDNFGTDRYAVFTNRVIDHNKRVFSGTRGTASELEIPEDILAVLGWMYDYVKQEVHKDERVAAKYKEAKHYISLLHEHFQTHWPEEAFQRRIVQLCPELGTDFSTGYSFIRRYCDFITMHTDAEIISFYEQLFGPRHLEERIALI